MEIIIRRTKRPTVGDQDHGQALVQLLVNRRTSEKLRRLRPLHSERPSVHWTNSMYWTSMEYYLTPQTSRRIGNKKQSIQIQDDE
ncbi:hypothetical protein J6590_000533 [Homalodisca vitripennis]|nr:hypothetical protein J6590_000533 [Homalodisca vitripennis]